MKMREANDSQAGAATRPWLSYSLAVLAAAGAALLRWALDPLLRETQPFATFYIAILLVTLGRGWRPGLACAALGFLVGDWFFLAPRGSLSIVTLDALAHTLIYFLVAGALIYSLHRSRRIGLALAVAHESLRQSEERLRATFQKAAVGIMQVDTQGRCIAANERVCQILGYRPAELVGKTVHELTAPEDLAQSDQLNAELREGRRERLDYEKRYRRRDGSSLWVYVTASAVRDAAGHVLYFIGTAEDISERKQAEERLRFQLLLTQGIADAAAVCIFVTDAQGRVTFMNPEAERVFGFSFAELQGQGMHDAIHHHYPDGRPFPQHECPIGKVYQSGETTRSYEELFFRKDGSTVPVVCSNAALWVEGKLAGAVLVAQDITERKRAEGALLQAKQEWERTFDSVPDLIAIIDGERHIKRVNRAMAERLGLAPEHCVGLTCFECLHGTTCAPEFCPHALTLADGRIHSSEVHEERLGGDFLVTTTPLLDEGGQMVGSVHVSRDITAAKQAEAALREQAQLAQLRADATQVLQQPGAMQALLQHVAALLVERLDVVFARVWTLDPSGQTLELHASAGLYTHLDGAHSRVPVGQFKIGRIAQGRRPLVTNQVLGDPNVPSQDWVRREGLVSFAGMPLLLEGRLLGVVAFFSRHTLSPAVVETFESIAGTLAQALGRKQAELALQASKEELAHANAELEQRVSERTAKLQETVAELEQFSYTLTHDMRAPLRAMRGLGGVLLEECVTDLSPERYEHLRRIADSAERMDKLITDALQYSGVLRQALALEPVDAEALLRGILDSYPQFQPPRASIRIVGRLPVVLGNAAALTQCFSNLLGNAVKFVPPGKTPEVRVWAELVDSGKLIADSPKAQLPSGDHPSTIHYPLVQIWFQDNGIGIEREYQDKIWLMFQRLHKSYAGTGIGLALVSKAIERMGGKVGVESEPGRGSRFWLQLRHPPGALPGHVREVAHTE